MNYPKNFSLYPTKAAALMKMPRSIISLALIMVFPFLAHAINPPEVTHAISTIDQGSYPNGISVPVGASLPVGTGTWHCSWLNSNWATSDVPFIVTSTAGWLTNVITWSGGCTASPAVSASSQATSIVAVVEVDSISPDAKIVSIGTEIDLQVKTIPAGRYDIVNVVASGATILDFNKITGIIKVKFDKISIAATDYKTIIAACGASYKTIQTTVFSLDLVPVWPAAKDGENSPDLFADVCPSGLSGLTFAWFWSAPAGVGNSPMVNFTTLSSETTAVVNAHWFADPDNISNCAAQCYYTIGCKASYGSTSATNIIPFMVEIPREGGLTTCSGKMINYPEIKEDLITGKWVVDGFGNLEQDKKVNTAIFVSTTSQFYNKVVIHEKKHHDDFMDGYDSHKFFDKVEFWLMIFDMTADDEYALQTKIDDARNKYLVHEMQELWGCHAEFETRAYAISDAIDPKYFYLLP